MKTRKLGNVQVSAIGLGTMSFGTIFGPTDQAESLACLDAIKPHYDAARAARGG